MCRAAARVLPAVPALPAVRTAGGVVAVAAFAVVVAAASPARAQPKIDLPPDEPAHAVPKPAAIALPREGAIETPLDESTHMTGTALGGYGEVTLNAPVDGPNAPVAEVRRLVLYVGHNFTERLRLYSEIEIEHAVSSASDRGEVEVEQAFIDFLGWRWLNLRAGLVLVPVGIVNVYHEPPSFHGVDRPLTDQVIVPSTWREIGVGAFGAIGAFRYQAYVMTAFDAHGFTFDQGLREGHQEGQLASAKTWAAVGRLDWAPFAGADVGVSGYAGDSGQASPDFGSIPTALAEIDARVKWKGLEARAELANVWIANTPELNRALFTAGVTDGPVSRQSRGGYLEIGYNVLRPFNLSSGMALDAFGRYERVDTQADVFGGFSRRPGGQREVWTFGVSFRPIAEVVAKLDYQRWWTDDGPTAWNQVNAGLGWMF